MPRARDLCQKQNAIAASFICDATCILKKGFCHLFYRATYANKKVRHLRFFPHSTYVFLQQSTSHFSGVSLPSAGSSWELCAVSLPLWMRLMRLPQFLCFHIAGGADDVEESWSNIAAGGH